MDQAQTFRRDALPALQVGGETPDSDAKDRSSGAQRKICPLGTVSGDTGASSPTSHSAVGKRPHDKGEEPKMTSISWGDPKRPRERKGGSVQFKGCTDSEKNSKREPSGPDI